MAALLLIFVFLFLVTHITSASDNAQKLAQLELQREELRKVRTELQRAVQHPASKRNEIIKALQEAFAARGIRIKVEDTGAVRFSRDVLFDWNTSQLSLEGEEELDRFVPIYAKILLSERFRDDIAQIIVEGHTDSSSKQPGMSGYLYNLGLSQARAYAVVAHILDVHRGPKFPEKLELRQLLRATGRSYSDLIIRNGVEDDTKSRRVEFRFLLKEDEEVYERMQQLIDQVVEKAS